MIDVLAIACGAGFQDGLNPCFFLIATVFLALNLWVRSSSWPGIYFSLIFVLGCFLGIFCFNFTYAQILVVNKVFPVCAKGIILILGAGSFVLGCHFLKEWFGLYRRDPVLEQAIPPGKQFVINNLSLYSLTFFAGMLLSAVATLWPINSYILILGNGSILRGQLKTVMPMLIIYDLISLWPLWLVWSFNSIKKLQPSVLNIFYALVFLIASSSVVLILK